MTMRGPALLLDGGLSNVLNNLCSFDVHEEKMWTSKALQVEPESVVKTHCRYIRAGADIIETSSYQASIQGFKQYMSLDVAAGEKLIRDSVVLAKRSVSESPGFNPMIGGSMGPYGVLLCNGSEYSGNYLNEISDQELRDFHTPRIRCLLEGGVDLLAIETFPALKEARIVFNILKESFPTSKAWISFTLKDPSTNSYGDSMEEAFKSMAEYAQLWGFGINCGPPDLVSPFLKKIRLIRDVVRPDVKLIVYPNTGEDWIPGHGWIKSTEIKTIDTWTKEWLELGADVIGGCCQVGPETIEKMRPIIDKWNSEHPQ